jgi:hypothetical protein
VLPAYTIFLSKCFLLLELPVCSNPPLCELCFDKWAGWNVCYVYLIKRLRLRLGGERGWGSLWRMSKYLGPWQPSPHYNSNVINLKTPHKKIPAWDSRVRAER